MLRRALSNLLSNAIHHCPAGETVTIRLVNAAAGAIVAVENPGSIPAENLPRLFDRFFYWHPVTPSPRGWRRSGPGHRQMDCHRPRRHDLGPFGERPEQVRHTPAPKAGANLFSSVSVKIATHSIVGPCLRQNRHPYARRSQALRASSRSTISAAKPSAISQTSTPIGAVSNSQLPVGV